MANLVQAMAGTNVIARYAHMELAEPSIEAGPVATYHVDRPLAS